MSYEYYLALKLANKLKFLNCNKYDISNIYFLLNEFEKIYSLKSKKLFKSKLLNSIIIIKEEKEFKVSFNNSVELHKNKNPENSYVLKDAKNKKEIIYRCVFTFNEGHEFEKYFINFISLYSFLNYFNKINSEDNSTYTIFSIRHGVNLFNLEDQWANNLKNNTNFIDNFKIAKIYENNKSEFQDLRNFQKNSDTDYTVFSDPTNKLINKQNKECFASVNVLLNYFKNGKDVEVGFFKIFHRFVKEKEDSFFDLPGGGNSYMLNNKKFRQNSLISAIRELVEETTYLAFLNPLSLSYFHVELDHGLFNDEEKERNVIYNLGILNLNANDSIFNKKEFNYQTLRPNCTQDREIFRYLEFGNEAVGHLNFPLIAPFKKAMKKIRYDLSIVLSLLTSIRQKIYSNSKLSLEEEKTYDIIESSLKIEESKEIIKFFLKDKLKSKNIYKNMLELSDLDFYIFTNKLLTTGKKLFLELEDTIDKSSLNYIENIIINGVNSTHNKDFLLHFLYGLGSLVYLDFLVNESDKNVKKILDIIFSRSRISSLKENSNLLSEILLNSQNNFFLINILEKLEEIIKKYNIKDHLYYSAKKIIDVKELFNQILLSIIYQSEKIYQANNLKIYENFKKIDFIKLQLRIYIRPNCKRICKNFLENNKEIEYPIYLLPEIIGNLETNFLKLKFTKAEIIVIKKYKTKNLNIACIRGFLDKDKLNILI